mmetsp:Transcript_43096/g.99244  ORF Transcript_43096/g.99244 Transcript_43096/m.99244 type:complete len:545 (-) Transcript_43096:126-1760(-)
MLPAVLTAAATGSGGGGVNAVGIFATCLAASVAAVVTRRSATKEGEETQAEASSRSDGVMPSDAPYIECFHDGLHAVHDGFRYVAVSTGVLYIGRTASKVDDLLPLDGAKVMVNGVVVSIATKKCSLLSLSLASEDEAKQWAEKLREASKTDEFEGPNTAAESGGEATAASVAHQARIEQLEKRVNATLKEAVSRAQRIQELEVQVQEGREQREHRQKTIQELKATAEQGAKEVSAKAKQVAELRESEKQAAQEVKAKEAAAASLAEELAAKGTNKESLQGVVNTVQDMMSSVQETGVDDADPIRLRASAQEVEKAMPQTDKDVTELMEGMVSALRWPNALRKRLAAAEQAARDHRMVQDASAQQLEDLKAQFDKERLQKEEAEARAVEFEKQLAIAQYAANEAAEKLLALEDARVKETTELARQIQVAEAAADANTAKLKDVLAIQDGALQQQIVEVEAQKVAAEATAEDLRGRLAATRQAAADAEAQLHNLQASKHGEISELRRQLAIARETMLDTAPQLEDETRRETLQAAKSVVQQKEQN